MLNLSVALNHLNSISGVNNNSLLFLLNSYLNVVLLPSDKLKYSFSLSYSYEPSTLNDNELPITSINVLSLLKVKLNSPDFQLPVSGFEKLGDISQPEEVKTMDNRIENIKKCLLFIK